MPSDPDDDLAWLYGRDGAAQGRAPQGPDGPPDDRRGRPGAEPRGSSPGHREPGRGPAPAGPPRVEHTRVMTQEEIARLAGTDPRAADRGAQRPRPVPPPGRPGAHRGGARSAGQPPPFDPTAHRRPGPPPGGAPRRRRHPVRTTLLTVIVVIVAGLTWLVAVPVGAFSGAAKVASTPAGARPAQQPGTLYLLVGSDSRAGLSAAEKKQLGTGTVAGGRTDTIILLYAPPVGKPVMISVPRDSYVEIPGHGKNKINAAFSLGGPKLLISTLEQATGLRVDRYVEIGFAGFAGLVDAVGGVEVCLSKPMNDPKAHINLPKGCQNLDGPKALGYVRARYSDPLGDLGRVQRQREIVSKIMSKAATPATVLNPFRYWKLSHAAADAVVLGDGTGLTAMPRFALAMRAISRSGGITLTVPIATAGLHTPNAGIAVQWDEAKAKALFADLARGDTSDVAKYAKK